MNGWDAAPIPSGTNELACLTVIVNRSVDDLQCAAISSRGHDDLRVRLGATRHKRGRIMTVIPAEAGIQRGERRHCATSLARPRARFLRHFQSLDSGADRTLCDRLFTRRGANFSLAQAFTPGDQPAASPLYVSGTVRRQPARHWFVRRRRTVPDTTTTRVRGLVPGMNAWAGEN